MSAMTKIRPLLWERARGRCEVSGLPLDYDTFDAHHRRNKGMGGTSRDNRDCISNLLALDPQVHNGGPRSVHGRATWSRPRGYLVRKHVAHPEGVEVLLRGQTWVRLGTDGLYRPVGAVRVDALNATLVGESPDVYCP